MEMLNWQPNDSAKNISGKEKSIKKNSTYSVNNSIFNLKPDIESDQVSLNNQIENIDKAVSDKMLMLKCNLETKSGIPDCGLSFASRSVYTNKHSKHPHSKRKSIPITAYLTNNSAKAVLFERSIEIKDLESKVKYLQNKIKDLEKENKTLHDVQCKQEKELRKFKESVADIPSLLKSHKEETKVLESTLATIRKELRDCQKEVKTKNEIILKKAHQIEKLNASLRLGDKSVQDLSNEVKELKKAKMELEAENRKLFEANEKFKFENEDLQNKIKEMVCRILNLEENMDRGKNLNKQQKRDNELLQLKYEELKNEVSAGQTCILPDNDISHNSAAEVSSRCCPPVLPQRCLESGCKGLKKISVMQESQEKLFDENSVNKVKEALLHTFKRYQDMCMNGSSNSCFAPLRSTSSHLKPLPPLKSSRNHTQFVNSMKTDKCASLLDENFAYNSNMNHKSIPKECHSSSLNGIVHVAEVCKNHSRISTGSDLIGDDCKNPDESVKDCSPSQFSGSWLEDL